MARPELSRRIGHLVCAKPITIDERNTIVAAAVVAKVWEDLPARVRGLVETVESRLDTSRSTVPDEDDAVEAGGR